MSIEEKTQRMYGRRIIFTDVDEITEHNVISVLEDTLPVHENNKAEIKYLYNYWKGKQPILGRAKEIRPEINNIIVENRANEIVSFKSSYLMGEPVQYINRSKENISDSLNLLNEFMFYENKEAKDKTLTDWFTICGTGYRMVLPVQYDNPDEAPFNIYILNPMQTYVVYHNGLGNREMMSVHFIKKKDGTFLYIIYTDCRYFEIVDDGTEKKIRNREYHSLRNIPIIEYLSNEARLGAFEVVLPILDAINNVASNRIDAVEQFVQAILVIAGGEIEEKVFKSLKHLGGLNLPEGVDAKYLVQELNQMQTQTLVDCMYQTVLTICGMPNRNGGTSTSDTGKAVIMRDGWTNAEARAKDSEKMFKLAEKKFLKIALYITNTLRGTELKLSDIDIRLPRRNYENVLEKAQVLTMLLQNPKIHPKLAFEHSDMFVDPEFAYTISDEYYREYQQKKVEEVEEYTKSLVDGQKKEIDDEGEEDV